MIKMIALDLDNTLLLKDLTIPQETIDVLHEASERGVHVVISSGRMRAAAKRYADVIGTTDSIVCCNGAEIYSGDGKLMHDAGIPVETVKELVLLCEKKGIYVQLYWGDDIVIERWNEKTEGYPDAHNQRVIEVGSWSDAVSGKSDGIIMQSSPKALLIGEPDTVEDMIADISEAMGGRLNFIRSSRSYVEVLAPGVSKGEGLRILAEKLGIDSSEVMACGDNMNDMAMVTWAGTGVAVANAVPALKEAADYVASQERSYGVAEAVRKFVLEKSRLKRRSSCAIFELQK